MLQGIQITATTPTSSAVQLETGSVDLEISNRVQRATGTTKQDQPAPGMCKCSPRLAILFTFRAMNELFQGRG